MAEQLFLSEENQEVVFSVEKNEEWKKTIEELGLDGQKKLIEGGDKNSPVPFQFMNTSMERMFKTLCPLNVEVAKYEKTPIPLKILGIIKLSEREGYFKEMEVWYDDVEVDPILVGKNDTGLYLLARWGDMLRNFDELMKMAKKRWIEKGITTLKEKITDAEESLKKIELLCEKHFRGEWVYF